MDSEIIEASAEDGGKAYDWTEDGDKGQAPPPRKKPRVSYWRKLQLDRDEALKKCDSLRRENEDLRRQVAYQGRLNEMQLAHEREVAKEKLSSRTSLIEDIMAQVGDLEKQIQQASREKHEIVMALLLGKGNSPPPPSQTQHRTA